MNEIDDLEKLKTAYKNSEAHLTAMHEIRYHPWFAAAYKAYQDGLLGEIQLITAQKSYGLGQRPDFYKKRATYGGTILWVGIHAIDWIYWFTNGEISEVSANHTTSGNNDHGELESSALCFYRLKNGGQASVNIDYLRPQGRKQHADDRIRIAGTKGLLEVRDNKAVIITDKKTYELPLAEKKLIFNEFINYIYKDRDFMLTEDVVFRVTELAIRTRMAADQKRVITLLNHNKLYGTCGGSSQESGYKI
jgi:predicted dehydrogenase